LRRRTRAAFSILVLSWRRAFFSWPRAGLRKRPGRTALLKWC
jgi:hypothetical protein